MSTGLLFAHFTAGRGLAPAAKQYHFDFFVIIYLTVKATAATKNPV